MAHFGQEPDTDAAREIQRVRLAQEFGWTMTEIDRLITDDPFTVAAIWGVLDGQRKVTDYEHQKARRRK